MSIRHTMQIHLKTFLKRLSSGKKRAIEHSYSARKTFYSSSLQRFSSTVTVPVILTDVIEKTNPNPENTSISTGSNNLVCDVKESFQTAGVVKSNVSTRKETRTRTKSENEIRTKSEKETKTKTKSEKEIRTKSEKQLNDEKISREKRRKVTERRKLLRKLEDSFDAIDSITLVDVNHSGVMVRINNRYRNDKSDENGNNNIDKNINSKKIKNKIYPDYLINENKRDIIMNEKTFYNNYIIENKPCIIRNLCSQWPARLSTVSTFSGCSLRCSI